MILAGPLDVLVALLTSPDLRQVLAGPLDVATPLVAHPEVASAACGQRQTAPGRQSMTE
jgi:hypothetical protein